MLYGVGNASLEAFNERRNGKMKQLGIVKKEQFLE